MPIDRDRFWLRWTGRALAGVTVLFVVVQLVPYGRHHAAPPVTRDAPWVSASDRRLAVAACYDCHSNRTRWRWYTNVAPSSWLTQSHVDEGRAKLDFSEWDRPQRTRDMGKAVRGGSMPPSSYTLVHPDARLSAAERQRLVTALEALPSPGR
ncbi:MAG: hypothetical protein QOF60_283 [Actinomycetota bacterium]|jgi:hypothetical protein|nr:hypothetical protein [Actinomycetota bacterium]